MTFQLATDTASDLSFSYLDEHKIAYLGFTVTVDGKEYQTATPGSIEPDWFLEQLNKDVPATTSQINMGQFTEFFTKFAQENTSVLYLGFSSGLSGTFQSATQARELVLEDYPQADIRLVDTLQAANGQGLLVDYARKMRDDGKSIDEIQTAIIGLIPKIHAYFTVDDLNHLAKGGRISKTAATIGGLVNIKPIMDVDKEGRLRPIEKIRGRKKALKELVEKLTSDLDKPEEQTIFINYSGDDSDALKVKEMIMEKAPVKEVALNPLGPTIVTHTGSGCIAIFGIGNTDRD